MDAWGWMMDGEGMGQEKGVDGRKKEGEREGDFGENGSD